MSFNEEDVFNASYNPFDVSKDLPKINTGPLVDMLKNPLNNKLVSGLFNLVVSSKQGLQS